MHVLCICSVYASGLYKELLKITSILCYQTGFWLVTDYSHQQLGVTLVINCISVIHRTLNISNQ